MARLAAIRHWIVTHKRLALAGGIIGCLLLASLVLFVVLRGDAAKPQPIAAVDHTTDAPSESKAEAEAYAWKGGANDPKRLVLPSIGVDTFIQRMDVDQHGQVAAPNNIHLAGWFVKSVRPGETGLSIIDGHLNGLKSAQAVFTKLPKLKKDDIFTVVRGDGTKLEYTVLATQTLPVDEAASALYSQDPTVKSQLNLITCGGVFDRDTRHYDSRVVVSAALR